MCTTTSHYETHISTECSVGGSAQCDGYCLGHIHQECTCSCHSDWVGDLPQTVEGMRDWHDEEHDVHASFERGSEAERWSEAMVAAEHLAAVHPNKRFAVAPGQGRTIVVERY